MPGLVTINISPELRGILKELKQYPKESYNDVITRVVDAWKEK